MNFGNVFSKWLKASKISVFCERLVYNLLNANINKSHFIVSGKTAKHPLGTYDTLDYDTATHSSSIIALISEKYLICLSVCLSIYPIYGHENNVPSRLSPTMALSMMALNTRVSRITYYKLHYAPCLVPWALCYGKKWDDTLFSWLHISITSILPSYYHLLVVHNYLFVLWWAFIKNSQALVILSAWST